MPTSQKADVRPISFVLHNTATGAAPIVFPLVIRPEELTRSDTSRLTVHQTLGGAWADNFGPGTPILTLSGTTGWGGGVRSDGSGGRPDGFEEFKRLYDTVYSQWHLQRAAAAKAGLDPDKVHLIFADGLDEFTWLVAPQSFVLKRNKSRPLLSQYSICLAKLADAALPPKKEKPFGGALEALGFGSLSGSIVAIANFAKSIKGAIAAALGPIKAAFQTFVNITTDVLNQVKGAITIGKNFLFTVAAPLLDLARVMSQAAHNVVCIVGALKSIPAMVRAKFMQVTGAFRNVFCVLKNVFKSRKFYPDYSSIYGASTCSSTNGGSPPSPYAGDNDNVFKAIFAAQGQKTSVTNKAYTAVNGMARLDTANTVPLPTLGSMMAAANEGTNVTVAAA